MATHSNGPSLATSLASFKTALEQIDDDTSELSFSSILTSRQVSNSPIGCILKKDVVPATNESEVQDAENNIQLLNSKGSGHKQDDILIKRPEAGQAAASKNSSKQFSTAVTNTPVANTEKHTKQKSTPLGISRYKNGSKSVMTVDDRSKRTGTNVIDKRTKASLNSSF